MCVKEAGDGEEVAKDGVPPGDVCLMSQEQDKVTYSE